jgi:hypothetical protein
LYATASAAISRSVMRKARRPQVAWFGWLLVVMAIAALGVASAASAGETKVTIDSFSYDSADSSGQSLILEATYTGSASLVEFNVQLAGSGTVSNVSVLFGGTTSMTNCFPGSMFGIDCIFAPGEIPGGTKFTIKFKTAPMYPANQANIYSANDGSGETVGTFMGPTAATSCQTVSIAPTSLPAATAGTAYTQQLTGAPPGDYSFSSDGTLPPGLSVNMSGEIHGTPTTAGTWTFTVLAFASESCQGSQEYTLIVNPMPTGPCPTITLSPPSLPTGAPGQPYSEAITASGGSGPYTFKVTEGDLPPGLTLGADGALTGTPTASGTFKFVVSAFDSNHCPGTRSYSIDVYQPVTPRKCHCLYIYTLIDKTVLNKKRLPPDKQDFGIGFEWGMDCTRGNGGCHGTVGIKPPEIFAGTLPKSPTGLHLSLAIDTILCKGPCHGTAFGRFEVKLRSRDQLNKLFGRVLAFKLVTNCPGGVSFSNEVNVFIDKHGVVRRPPRGFKLTSRRRTR